MTTPIFVADYTAYTLVDIDRVIPVTVTQTHLRGTKVDGYDVTDGKRTWFTRGTWDTAAEAARVAGDMAHDLDL